MQNLLSKNQGCKDHDFLKKKYINFSIMMRRNIGAFSQINLRPMKPPRPNFQFEEYNLSFPEGLISAYLNLT